MNGQHTHDDDGPKLLAPVPAKVFMAMQYLDWCRECQVHYSDSEIGDKVKRLELDPKEKAVKTKALGVLEQYFGGESSFDNVVVPEGMPATQKGDDDRPKAPVTS
ncbi:hypothetical protein LCGC14_1887400 [marine sediment metagenome]|uniref:Uncharacterized protein n=1 Tax=marine sediment metagenome TaxID=412755 RepID=A0A0F9IEB6_9ZZZZ